MMITSLLLLLSVVTTEAFVAGVPPTLKATVALRDAAPTTTRDKTDVLAQLQHEYKVLQEKLLRDIVIQHDEEDAEMVEEQMIDIATKATKILEDQQLDAIQEAERTRSQAEDARKRVLEVFEKDREHDSADYAICSELVSYSHLKGLEATNKIKAANTLLAQLKENEVRLQATLEALKEERHKSETTAVSLEKEVHTQHRSFLEKTKDAIMAHPEILVNMDPHIF